MKIAESIKTSSANFKDAVRISREQEFLKVIKDWENGATIYKFIDGSVLVVKESEILCFESMEKMSEINEKELKSTVKKQNGRPSVIPGGTKAVCVSMDSKTMMLAKTLGNGNVSEGIRTAVMIASNSVK